MYVYFSPPYSCYIAEFKRKIQYGNQENRIPYSIVIVIVIILLLLLLLIIVILPSLFLSPPIRIRLLRRQPLILVLLLSPILSIRSFRISSSIIFLFCISIPASSLFFISICGFMDAGPLCAFRDEW
jgi:hypothetical protein